MSEITNYFSRNELANCHSEKKQINLLIRYITLKLKSEIKDNTEIEYYHHTPQITHDHEIDSRQRCYYYIKTINRKKFLGITWSITSKTIVYIDDRYDRLNQLHCTIKSEQFEETIKKVIDEFAMIYNIHHVIYH